MPCQSLLPPVLDLAFIQRGPAGTAWNVPTEPLEIVAESGSIRHAEPIALVALAAWSELLTRQGVRISVSDSTKSKYAWNIGLLSALAGRTPLSTQTQAYDGWFPLCRAPSEGTPESSSSDVTASDAFAERFGQSVGDLLHTRNSGALPTLSYTMKELVNNVHHHAYSLSKAHGAAFFAAGWFRNQGRVTIAVGDSGVGIRAHLMARGLVAADDTDAIAIERAIQPRVTGAADATSGGGGPGNAGVGLHMTRMFVRACRGDMSILSGQAMFSERDGISRFEPVAPWKGTLVQLTLHPERMPAFHPLFESLVAGTAGNTHWKLKFTAGPRESLELDPPVDSTGFAADKSWFASKRDAVTRELDEGGMVSIDFGKARYSTQGAIHALLYEPLRQLGPAVLERLWFSNAGPQVRAVLIQVVSYALDEYASPAPS